MVGWLKKYHTECPRCGSPQVRVPWELGRVRGRRLLARALVALWLTMAGWAAFGVAIGSIWPWVAALVAYLALSVGALLAAGRSLRRFDCVACRYRWVS